MRDSHGGMPELVDAYERSGLYFGIARVTLGQETRILEFGIPVEDYKALRRILQTRPFDQLPGLRYRYFITGSIGVCGEHRGTVDIRIEQGHNGRQIEFEMPLMLARNLHWFATLRDFGAASHLSVVVEATPDA